MGQVLPDIPASELSALVRAVRVAGRDNAISARNQNLRAATLAFAMILAGILHIASGRAWNPPQAHFRAEEELQMVGALRGVVVSSALVVGSGALAQNAVQWRVQDGGNGHWYGYSADIGNWDTGRSFATARGGDLATLTSAAENAFVLSTIPRGVGTGLNWIGAFRANGAWRWVSGEVWQFAAWAPNEPNGGDGQKAWLYSCCGSLPVPTELVGRWNDHPQDLGYSGIAVIEWSADCNGDGIVDYGQCRDGSLPDYNGNNIPDCCEDGTSCVIGNYPVQWRVEDGGNGHWYATSDELGSWDAMQTLASERGGALASLTSAAENGLANRLRRAIDAPAGGGPWIGARKLPGQPWAWIDGSPWGFTNWVPGEPCCGDAGLYVHLVTSGQWQDHNQTEYQCRALIEWSADCNNDGLVDYGQILTGQLVDTNQNGVPDICEADPCPGDITGNGSVTGLDLAAVLDAWGTDGQSKFDSDVNNDGTVDGSDLAIVLGGWGPCP